MNTEHRLVILDRSSVATHCDHGIPLIVDDCPGCLSRLASQAAWEAAAKNFATLCANARIRPRIPCERLICRDPFCDRPHLCANCGKEDCACGSDCTSDRDYWLDRSELVK